MTGARDKDQIAFYDTTHSRLGQEGNMQICHVTLQMEGR